MLTTLKQKVKGMTLVPAGGGCFELTANGELVYSKLATGKFPDEQEIVDQLERRSTKK